MAGNPHIALGSLNRLRTSLVVENYPNLNVTAAFLGRGGIVVAFEGETTMMIPTMTGLVASPMPFQPVTVTVALIKTTGLAQQWENQRTTLSTIGAVTVTTDATTLANYTFRNCAIDNVRELNFAGDDAGYIVTIKGYYSINNSLWGV
jgi:acid phosphatase family membrane protein YuiD